MSNFLLKNYWDVIFTSSWQLTSAPWSNSTVALSMRPYWHASIRATLPHSPCTGLKNTHKWKMGVPGRGMGGERILKTSFYASNDGTPSLSHTPTTKSYESTCTCTYTCSSTGMTPNMHDIDVMHTKIINEVLPPPSLTSIPPHTHTTPCFHFPRDRVRRIGIGAYPYQILLS